MDDDTTNAAGLITGLAALLGACGTGLGLGVISLFAIPNAAALSDWGSVALLCLGGVASVVGIVLAARMVGRVGNLQATSTAALGVQGVLVIGALLWSARWIGDPGDWPFFGAPPLIYAGATGALIVMALLARRAD